MTDTLTVTTDRADVWLRATALLAFVAGSALVVDIVTIAVLNRAFDPLDSILFFTGFVGMLLAVLALSIHLSRGRRGGARAAAAAACFLAAVAVLGVISFAFDRFGRHTFDTSNKALHGEWSFFSIAVCLLLLAAWAQRRRSQWRRSASA